MKEDLYDDLYLEEKEEKTDFKAVLFKYTIHWPWFVACILLCLAGAWLYLRYTAPVYNISASVIIKDNDKNSKSNTGIVDLEGTRIIRQTRYTATLLFYVLFSYLFQSI